MSKLYPLRDRIRYKIPYWIQNTWNTIRFWFNPRQKWLIKKIPNNWIDKDTLWELCILEGIKHAVEEDNVLGGWGKDWHESFSSSQSDPNYPEHQKVFDREMKQAYEDVTGYIPMLEWILENEWDKVPSVDFNNLSNRGNLDYNSTYGLIDKLEKEIYDKKTEVMVWAIKNRSNIWT